MRVIGAGFGRTGTMSLKLALDRLGVGPCYHMYEIIDQPWRAAGWLAALRGAPDWPGIFAGYRSTVDWPAAAFWRELVSAYPAAKVVLTVRDADRWYDSMRRTILAAMRARRERPGPPPDHLRDFEVMAEVVVGQRVFGGGADDPDRAIATFHRHNAEVRATVPADRLLVFDVAQGWAPLCDFLGVPVPAEPFPRRNDAAEFRSPAGLQ